MSLYHKSAIILHVTREKNVITEKILTFLQNIFSQKNIQIHLASLAEVDRLCDGPGHVLPDAGRRAEAPRRPLRRAIVRQARVQVSCCAPSCVEHAGALVRPDLRQSGQFVVPPSILVQLHKFLLMCT